jgi:dipeptidyl aminopeptidase/acylaminoacyl peptidase
MSRPRSCLLLVLPLALGFLSGCGEPVRRDRGIQISADGKEAAFVDEREGVFVADTEGGQPVRIARPGPDSLAVSVPLWAPADRRLVFAVARKAGGDKAAFAVGRDDPDGAVDLACDVVYTVYLREAPRGAGDNPEPRQLFSAPCDHPGYVAANLAVRWRPDGRALLFVRQVGEGRHAVCEYDLATGQVRRAFPHEAPAVVFDFAPDGKTLACVAGGERPETAGLWLGTPGGDWWRVPGSRTNARGEFRSALERLKAARPAWAPDGSRLLLAVSTLGGDDAGPARHALLLAEPATRQVKTLLEGVEPARDLAWAPDGRRFGLIIGAADIPGELLLCRADDGAVGERIAGARRFAGWDRSGRSLAYVAAAPPPPSDRWLYLLPAAERARDLLMVKAEGQAARPVLSGVQVSFARWAPTEARLSLWASYRFAHGSPSAELLGLVAPPGDPAVLLDPATGRLDWKPVGPRDKAQIGHYYLIRGDAATAWRWYEEAEQGLAADGTKPALADFYTGRETSLFQAVCLERLGRHDESEARRARFEAAFPARWAEGMPAAARLYSADDWRHVRDLYVVEVLLSVNGGEEAERYLRDGLSAATGDADRLGKALLLAQVLLLRGKNAEYADVAAGTVLPLLLMALPAWRDGPEAQEAAAVVRLLLFRLGASPSVSPALLGVPLPSRGASVQALLPLATPAFLATLPEGQVRALAGRLDALRQETEDDARRLALDVLLAGAWGRLGEQDLRQEAARRLAASPAWAALSGGLTAEKALAALDEAGR